MLETLITSKTRLRLLIKFFLNERTRCHLRGLAEEFGESTNSIRKELNKMSEAGYLESEPEQNRIVYQANIKHPLFNTLKVLVSKHLGLDVLLEKVLDRMGAVDRVLVIGDYAHGIDSGTINIAVVGEKLNADYLAHLETRLEGLIGRKVDITGFGRVRDVQEGLVLYDRATDELAPSASRLGFRGG